MADAEPTAHASSLSGMQWGSPRRVLMRGLAADTRGGSEPDAFSRARALVLVVAWSRWLRVRFAADPHPRAREADVCRLTGREVDLVWRASESESGVWQTRRPRFGLRRVWLQASSEKMKIPALFDRLASAARPRYWATKSVSDLYVGVTGAIAIRRLAERVARQIDGDLIAALRVKYARFSRSERPWLRFLDYRAELVREAFRVQKFKLRRTDWDMMTTRLVR